MCDDLAMNALSTKLTLCTGRLNLQSKTVKYSKAAYEVSSVAEASQKWAEMRDASGVGSRSAPSVFVLDEQGNQVALISYNGKAWTGDVFDQLNLKPFVA